MENDSPPAPVRIFLCNVAEIAKGEMRRFELTRLLPIAVFNVDGEFFATQDRCSHGGASLTGDGILNGHIIECTWHDGSFDVRSGEGVAAPCRRRLRVFRVELVGEALNLILTPTQALEAGLDGTDSKET